MNLTQEQKRIRIAEARGRVVQSDGPPDYCLIGLRKGVHQPDDAPVSIPDYFGSVDAIMPAVRELPAAMRSVFLSRLADVLIESGLREISTFDYAAATAEQHAEAFGRTLNLW